MTIPMFQGNITEKCKLIEVGGSKSVTLHPEYFSIIEHTMS